MCMLIFPLLIMSACLHLPWHPFSNGISQLNSKFQMCPEAQKGWGHKHRSYLMSFSFSNFTTKFLTVVPTYVDRVSSRYSRLFLRASSVACIDKNKITASTTGFLQYEQEKLQINFKTLTMKHETKKGRQQYTGYCKQNCMLHQCYS